VATMVGKENKVSSLLNDLIELDYDAIEAYEAAIERLKDVNIRAQMERFCEDHRRHVMTLSPILSDMGMTPPLQGDIKRVLTKGKVVLGALMGDKAILMAMKTNEDDTNTAYDRAVGRSDLTVQLREILSRHLADERRHRAWIEAQLGAMRVEGVRDSVV
jgi:uncharacterized protein (TIGR02284 family)